jgi:signal transduction histidine kinase
MPRAPLFLLFISALPFLAEENEARAQDGSVPALLDRLALFSSRELRSLDDQREEFRRALEALPRPAQFRQSESLGYHSALASAPARTKWVQVDLGATTPLDAIALVPAHASFAEHPGPGYGFPLRFRVDVSDDPGFLQFETVADHTDADVPNPGDAPFLIPTSDVKARYVRVTATKFWSRKGRAFFALGELIVLAGPRDVAAGKAVTALDSIETPPEWARRNLVDFQSVLGPPVLARDSTTNGFHSQVERQPEVTKWVQIDLGSTQPLDEVWLFPAHPPDYADRVGFGFPRRFRIEVADDPEFVTPRLLLDRTAADFANPGDCPVVIDGRREGARFVRITATRLWERSSDYIFALAEAQVFSGGKNVALGAPVAASDELKIGAWSRAFLVDGANSLNQFAPFPDWLHALSQRRELAAQLAGIEPRRARLVAAQWHTIGSVLARTVIVLALGGAALLWRARHSRRAEIERLRTRIASDLHDEIGSNLGSIALLSQLAAQDRAHGGETQREFQEIRQIAEQTAESMRDIVWLLRPGGEGDLVARLRDTAARMLAGVAWEFAVAETPPPSSLPLEFKREVFLLFKEALNNIRRHAHAARVTIGISAESGTFRLTICDDGRGFDPARVTGGTGLKNLAQRASALRGDLQITSAPDQGTRLVLTAPFT